MCANHRFCNVIASLFSFRKSTTFYYRSFLYLSKDSSSRPTRTFCRCTTVVNLLAKQSKTITLVCRESQIFTKCVLGKWGVMKGGGKLETTGERSVVVSDSFFASISDTVGKLRFATRSLLSPVKSTSSAVFC